MFNSVWLASVLRLAALAVLALHEHVPGPAAGLRVVRIDLHALGVALDLGAAGTVAVLLGNSLSLSGLSGGLVLGEEHVADAVTHDATSGNGSDGAHHAHATAHATAHGGGSTVDVHVCDSRLLAGRLLVGSLLVGSGGPSRCGRRSARGRRPAGSSAGTSHCEVVCFVG
jgi:hypothetical protein